MYIVAENEMCYCPNCSLLQKHVHTYVSTVCMYGKLLIEFTTQERVVSEVDGCHLAGCHHVNWVVNSIKNFPYV
jgi:hypothetical protein